MGKEINAKVDTVQISTDIENIREKDMVYDFGNIFKFVSKQPLVTKEAKLLIILQPSYALGNFETYSTLKEYNKRLNAMLEKLTVIDRSKVKVNRLDICVDFEASYEEVYTLGKIVSGLLNCYKFNKDFDFLATTEEFTGDKTHLKLGNSSFEVAFYDKEGESAGRHPYKSRLEFRFMRKSIKLGDEVKLIKKLIKDLKALKNVHILNNLEAIYAQKIINSVIKKDVELIQYVKLHRDDIITRECLKKAYLTLNKGKTTRNFNSWYKSISSRHNIKLHKWADIKAFINSLTRVLTEFIKNEN